MDDYISILNTKFTQPERYKDYSVPKVILPAVETLYKQRNVCADKDVEIIDEALVRLLSPWIKRGL